MKIENLKNNWDVASGQTRALVDRQQFLKILVAQLRHQNPLQPLKPDEFLTQLAQLTQVEQLQNINSSIHSLTRTLDQLSPLTLSSILGKKVESENQIMTKGDEIFVTPSEDYDYVTIVLHDVSTGDIREVSIYKGEPLIYRHEGENPVFVSAYGRKGNKLIGCQIKVYRVISELNIDPEGKVKVIFADGSSMYLDKIKRIKQ
ncbi:MAG: hypothetical protein NZ583_08800 [Desulfobacterota bacterium]|nr:hypothetical protein [Thermodesulfobacteriota bacterium]MDW8002799.1 flagellar hook capping FlgD N-terminal domain-containing protein [Deltaproteobacteria bacterium]